MEKRYRAENPGPSSIFPGWCATQVDMMQKVEEMGLCADKCIDNDVGIQYGTVNLLTQDECQYIFKKVIFAKTSYIL